MLSMALLNQKVKEGRFLMRLEDRFHLFLRENGLALHPSRLFSLLPLLLLLVLFYAARGFDRRQPVPSLLLLLLLFFLQLAL